MGHVLLTWLGSILSIARERTQAVFTPSFLDSGCVGGLLGHGRGASLSCCCRLGLHCFSCGDRDRETEEVKSDARTCLAIEVLTASILSILRLVCIETLHVVVELLLAGLLEPDLSERRGGRG